MERLVQFTFLGSKYKVYTGISDKEMGDILAFLQHVEEDLMQSGGNKLPAGKATVMACLDIASQYVRLQKEYDRYRLEMKKRISSLNSRIDTDLFQEDSSP